MTHKLNTLASFTAQTGLPKQLKIGMGAHKLCC